MGVRIPPALLTEQLKTKQLKTYLGSEVLLAACLALNQIGEGSNPSGPTIECGNRNAEIGMKGGLRTETETKFASVVQRQDPAFVTR